MLRLIDRIKKLASEYQEIVFWLPPALVLLFIAFKQLPILDPHSSIDGFGQLYAMLMNLAGGIVVCFSAWLTKRAYLGVWSDEDLLQAQTFLVSAAMTPGEKFALLAAVGLDLVKWILCFVFWYVVVFS
ncbi:MAG TPA: hypothetical protein VIQ76_16000 [Propionibacteriaceae bacterium]